MSVIAQLKKLAGESVVYGLSGVLSRFVGLFLLPLYAKVLSPSEYGIMGMYNSSFFTIFAFVVFAMDSATYRYYFDSNNAEKLKKSTIATWYYFQITVSITLAIVLFLFRNVVSVFLFKNDTRGIELTILMSIAIFMYALPNVLESWYRLQRKPWGAFLYSIATTGLSIILSAFCILRLKMGVMGFVIGQLGSTVLGTLYASFVMRGWLSLRFFDKKLLRNMIIYAFPLIPANIIGQLLALFSNYYLKSKLDFNESGLYYMGNTIASVIGLITMALGQAWGPFSFSIIDDPNSKKVYAFSLSAYVILMCGVCMGLMLFIPDLLRLFTSPKYYSSAWVSSILIFNGFFTSTAIIGLTGCGIVKKIQSYAKSVMAAAVVSIILIVPLTNTMGKEGVAIAILIGQLIIPISAFYVSQKYYPIPYEFKKLGVILLVSIILGVFGRIYFDHLYITVAIIVKILLVFLFYFCVYRIYRKEFVMFINLIKKRNTKG